MSVPLYLQFGNGNEIAQSIVSDLLTQDVRPLNDCYANGAGIYLIYYTGDFPAYEPLARSSFDRPIYAGKASPKGVRKGGDLSPERELASRLSQHAASINAVQNLHLIDFSVRFLTLDNVWIGLGERTLIDTFQPIWNCVIDGFGNKDPGVRRLAQTKSQWDVLHPGRRFAEKLSDHSDTVDSLLSRIDRHLREPACLL